MKKTEVYSRGDLNAKCELALMTGQCVSVRDVDNVRYCFEYIAKVVGSTTTTADEFWEMMTQYLDKDKTYPVGFCMNKVFGMTCMTIILHDKGEVNHSLDHEDGQFCYVYNFDAPDCSELGYSYFERRGNRYFRVA